MRCWELADQYLLRLFRCPRSASVPYIRYQYPMYTKTRWISTSNEHGESRRTRTVFYVVKVTYCLTSTRKRQNTQPPRLSWVKYYPWRSVYEGITGITSIEPNVDLDYYTVVNENRTFYQDTTCTYQN